MTPIFRSLSLALALALGLSSSALAGNRRVGTNEGLTSSDENGAATVRAVTGRLSKDDRKTLKEDARAAFEGPGSADLAKTQPRTTESAVVETQRAPNAQDSAFVREVTGRFSPRQRFETKSDARSAFENMSDKDFAKLTAKADKAAGISPDGPNSAGTKLMRTTTGRMTSRERASTKSDAHSAFAEMSDADFAKLQAKADSAQIANALAGHTVAATETTVQTIDRVSGGMSVAERIQAIADARAAFPKPSLWERVKSFDLRAVATRTVTRTGNFFRSAASWLLS